jgi:hypothetical protein
MSGKRRLAGWGAGIAVLALVALPVAVSALAAMVSFTGCFMGCQDPEPLNGALLLGLTLLLLALPLVAGLVTAGVLRARGWRIALIAALLLLGWQLSRGGII